MRDDLAVRATIPAIDHLLRTDRQAPQRLQVRILGRFGHYLIPPVRECHIRGRVLRRNLLQLMEVQNPQPVLHRERGRQKPQTGLDLHVLGDNRPDGLSVAQNALRGTNLSDHCRHALPLPYFLESGRLPIPLYVLSVSHAFVTRFRYARTRLTARNSPATSNPTNFPSS